MTQSITTIGLDLAKTVFQIHGSDGVSNPLLRKRLRRAQVLLFFTALQPCLIGMEVCGSAHYWARELTVLGHEVRLIAPQFVKPFVKTNKTDAQAICEAVLRPTMRFAPIKSAEQQSILMLHRARELLVRQKTQLFNALRGHCAEFGIVASQDASRIGELIAIIADEKDTRLPVVACEVLGFLVHQLMSVKAQLAVLEKQLRDWHNKSESCRRLSTIPGVGIITATALMATIGDERQFSSGRGLAAWLGLVPRQNSSGNKQRLGRISKRGDGYIRRLLVHGARANLRWAKAKQTCSAWLENLLVRKPTNVVLVALANKTARIAWALLTRKETYRTA